LIWGELLVSDRASDDALRTALARMFGLPDAAVALVASMEDAPRAAVIAEVTDAAGEFGHRIAVYVNPDILSPALPDGARELAATLCSALLIPNDDQNPYTMTWLSPSGDCREVAVDVEALDERGEYRVARWL
jgi:hypothetical protein